jgi:Domain of unknown function (DUF1841)
VRLLGPAATNAIGRTANRAFPRIRPGGDSDRRSSDTAWMSGGPSIEDQRARLQFVADPVVLAQLQLGLEDLADEDLRGVLIHAEHPEFEEALAAGVREFDGPTGPVNPRLHLIVHGIVATQLWDDSPPEVWKTAKRLLQAGYERHEVLHMLGRPVAAQVWEAWHDERAYDRDAHVAALDALPESWERERRPMRLERQNDVTGPSDAAAARKQARRKIRAARRRNRRRG